MTRNDYVDNVERVLEAHRNTNLTDRSLAAYIVSEVESLVRATAADRASAAMFDPEDA